MIPALIVPVLNRPDLLQQMLDSIDVPVDRIIVIDNGGVVGPVIQDCPWADIIRLPHNIGVAASWNLGIKVTPRARWFLIVNNDITFAPGDLALIAGAVTPREPGIWLAEEFSAFAITASTIDRIGFFDESFSPAYFEDNDARRRAVLSDVPIVKLETGITHIGSATIHSDPFYAEENHRTFSFNWDLYTSKWGGSPFQETFSTPFNRGGDIRPPQPDFNRLRQLAWRRRP